MCFPISFERVLTHGDFCGDVLGEFFDTYRRGSSKDRSAGDIMPCHHQHIQQRHVSESHISLGSFVIFHYVQLQIRFYRNE